MERGIIETRYVIGDPQKLLKTLEEKMLLLKKRDIKVFF